MMNMNKPAVYAGIRLLLLDLDGTVRGCTVKDQPCPNRTGQQELLPGAVEGILAAQRCGVVVEFVSNQGGIRAGFMTNNDLIEIHAELDKLLAAQGIDTTLIHAEYAVFDDWFRKPAPGMLLAAMARRHAGPQTTLMVGDMNSDRMAAHNAATHFMPADEWRNLWITTSNEENHG